MSVAEAQKSGIEKSGGSATIYQCVYQNCLVVLSCANINNNVRIAETLPQNVLELMHAPPKPAYPILEPADLVNFDAFIMGIPTRFGNFPAQWKVSVLLEDHLPISILTLCLFEGVLGRDRPAVGNWRACRQIRVRVRVNWHSRWRPRSDSHGGNVDAHAPRYPVRSARVQPHVRAAGQPH